MESLKSKEATYTTPASFLRTTESLRFGEGWQRGDKGKKQILSFSLFQSFSNFTLLRVASNGEGVEGESGIASRRANTSDSERGSAAKSN